MTVTSELIEHAVVEIEQRGWSRDLAYGSKNEVCPITALIKAAEKHHVGVAGISAAVVHLQRHVGSSIVEWNRRQESEEPVIEMMLAASQTAAV